MKVIGHQGVGQDPDTAEGLQTAQEPEESLGLTAPLSRRALRNEATLHDPGNAVVKTVTLSLDTWETHIRHRNNTTCNKSVVNFTGFAKIIDLSPKFPQLAIQIVQFQQFIIWNLSSIPAYRSKMRLPDLQTIVFLLFIPNMYAAEGLLIMDVYARVIPIGQPVPVPVPFGEGIVRGASAIQTEGLLALQGKSFQINPNFQDFAPIVPGVNGQKISIQFSAAVLENGNCQVSPFRAIALAGKSKGQNTPVGASEILRPGGFTLTPGSRIFESVTARSGGVTVIYYLIFSAAKGFADQRKEQDFTVGLSR